VKCAIIQSGIEPDSKGAPPRRRQHLRGKRNSFGVRNSNCRPRAQPAVRAPRGLARRRQAWRGALGQCLLTRRCVRDRTHDREAADRSRRQRLRFRSWCPGRPNWALCVTARDLRSNGAGRSATALRWPRRWKPGTRSS